MYLKNTKVKTGAYIRRTTKCIRPSDMHLVVRPICSLSHFFTFFFFSPASALFSQHKKGNRQSRFPSLFLAIPNLVQIQSKHLLRNLFHCSSRRPVSILFRTGYAVVIHKRHQVIRILDFSLDFGNLLFFFFF